jgi:hypothetical protein
MSSSEVGEQGISVLSGGSSLAQHFVIGVARTPTATRVHMAGVEGHSTPGEGAEAIVESIPKEGPVSSPRKPACISIVLREHTSSRWDVGA